MDQTAAYPTLFMAGLDPATQPFTASPAQAAPLDGRVDLQIMSGDGHGEIWQRNALASGEA